MSSSCHLCSPGRHAAHDGEENTCSLLFYCEKGQGLTRQAVITHDITQNETSSKANNAGDAVRY